MSRRRKNDLVREAVETLIAHGFTPIVSSGGKRLKISWIAAHHRHVLVISRSPSDWRARLNSRATLRRLLRQPALEGVHP
jgi:hypothetical protein